MKAIGAKVGAYTGKKEMNMTGSKMDVGRSGRTITANLTIKDTKERASCLEDFEGIGPEGGLVMDM